MPGAGRAVTLVLCRGDGEVLGALEPFEVATPWWMDVAPVLDVARTRLGGNPVVVRLLDADDRWPPNGGAVTYLVEVETDAPVPAHLRPVDVEADGDEPFRADWARPGGVAALVAWADTQLAAAGRARTGPPRQERTWNLSCVVRLPTDDGPVWLKAVPPFMAQEPAILALLHDESPGLAPVPIAVGDRVSLLQHIPGDDQYDAEIELLLPMVDILVGLQARWIGRMPELAASGLPSWDVSTLLPAADRLLTVVSLAPDLRASAERLVGELPARFAALAACGVPDSLVHGDFHPGNWRGTPEHLVLLDWGDSCIGNPMLDETAFFRSPIAQANADAIRARWASAWRAAVPGCEPERYEGFVDDVEASERRYHLHDAEDFVASAVEAAYGDQHGT